MDAKIAPEPGDEQADEAATSAPDVLEMALIPPARTRVDGILVGRIASVGEAVRVTFPGCADQAGIVARTMVQLDPRDDGAEVALMFELGDPGRPCVLGKMATSVPGIAAAGDGERVEIKADREIVLSCGEASITLTRAGKILIRGAYVVSASTGVNRLLGGSVEIN